MSRAVRHLAVRAPNWVGDLVMATPVIKAACADRRFERVSVIVREPLHQVLDGLIEPQRIARVASGREEVEVLRRLAPDACLLLTNSLGAAWRAWRARVPVRAGSALSGRRWLLSHAVVPPTRDGRRAATPTAHLLRDAAGLMGIAVPSLHPELAVSEAVRRHQRTELALLGLEPGERYAVCAPGASFGAAKCWAPDRFAGVLDALFERHGLRGVITGGPTESPTMEAVRVAARHRVISLAARQRDLVTLKALIAGGSILLVGDSGPRWYAAAFDVPCVCIMGPNFPGVTATSLERCEIVRVRGLECSPCAQRTCPLGHHRCMRDIDVTTVVAAAERALARVPEARRTSA